MTVHPLLSIKQRLASLLREDAIHHKLLSVTQRSVAKGELWSPISFTVLKNAWKNVMGILAVVGLIFRLNQEYVSYCLTVKLKGLDTVKVLKLSAVFTVTFARLKKCNY